jgi:hypothetical protein
MAITNFIQEIWSAKIIENFRNDSVWAGLANREYETEIRSGATLHLPGIVEVAIADYKAAGRITNASSITDTGIELVINQEKSFDFFVDDIDRAQSGASFDAYTASAVAGLVEDADVFLAELAVLGGVDLADTVEPTNAETAYNKVVALRLALGQAKVPAADRILVVNPEFEQFLVGYDSRLTDAAASGDTAGLREATIGRLAGFQVVVSANLPSATPQAVAMHRSALAYASQIDTIEAMRAESKIADRIRGLHVYGGLAVRPSAIQVFTAA